eukprot:TRINITY_DN4797_c0_g1_i1.p1 TRINITY_DN4797_c0_g1~~TRINITY_DN4797_c0_g1_i1.p1  ORF type:complete len:435 (-),score=45.10 TRINITY_DN4797_c0_g1_i1:301-1410(-)
MQGKDKELEMQKKSISSLAVTVVQQNKQIKSLLNHIEQNQQAQLSSMPGCSDGGCSGGQSQSSGEEDQEYYEDVQGGEAEDEEMFELKKQILGSGNFLQELEGDDSQVASVADGKRRRNSRMNSRNSSPFSQKSLGDNNHSGGFQGLNSKTPTPPASTKSGYQRESHRRSTTMDSAFAEEDSTRVSRSRSIQPRNVRQYNRMASMDSYPDDTSSVMSARGESSILSRVDSLASARGTTRPTTGYNRTERTYNRSYRDQDDSYRDEDNGVATNWRSSYARTSRDFSGESGSRASARSSELRRGSLVSRIGNSRLDSVTGSSTFSRGRLSRESSGHRRHGGDDDLDIDALNDKIDALENDGDWSLDDQYLE